MDKIKRVNEKENLALFFYLIVVCVLSGGESKATLLGLEGQEAGQQSLCDLQVIAVESGGCLSDITKLVGELLLHDGV